MQTTIGRREARLRLRWLAAALYRQLCQKRLQLRKRAGKRSGGREEGGKERKGEVEGRKAEAEEKTAAMSALDLSSK